MFDCTYGYDAVLPRMKVSTPVKLFSSEARIRRASVVGPAESVSVSVRKQNATRANKPIAAA